MAQPAITTKDDEFIAGGAVRDSAVNVDSKEQWRGYDERRFVQRMLRRLGGEGAMIARSGVATRLTCSFYTEAELRACKHVAAETRLPVGVSSILPYHFWNFGWQRVTTVSARTAKATYRLSDARRNRTGARHPARDQPRAGGADIARAA